MTLKYVLESLHEIIAKLKERDLDIYEAFCNIHSASDNVTSSPLNMNMRYPIWYQAVVGHGWSTTVRKGMPTVFSQA